MTLAIHAHLDYWFDYPTDVLLQFEAAAMTDQIIEHAHLDISPCEHFARVAALDGVGERIWVRIQGQLLIDYRATVRIARRVEDTIDLPIMPQHLLPGDTVQFLMPSRYCASDQFLQFVESEFGGVASDQKIRVMRDWVRDSLAYVPGSSTSDTTALDTFVKRQGICRDYAHVMIALARAAGAPARIASVFALGVDPPDFHAVAEVFLGGDWRLVDATGMAAACDMAIIGVGRDAADVAFMTAFGGMTMNSQSVLVERAEAG